MTNIEKLASIGILGGVRQRCGADNPHDNSQDDKINLMGNNELLKKQAGWVLGDSYWWTSLKAHFDALEEMDRGVG